MKFVWPVFVFFCHHCRINCPQIYWQYICQILWLNVFQTDRRSFFFYFFNINGNQMKCKLKPNMVDRYAFWETSAEVLSDRLHFIIFVLKPEYLSIVKSIPWLLMTWLFANSDHLQKTWYWLCRINGSLSSMRGWVSTTSRISVLRSDKGYVNICIYLLK